MTDKKDPINWDVQCGQDREGVTGMAITIHPLPDDRELLRALAERMRDAGLALLAERGVIEPDRKVVDLSEPDAHDTIQ